MTPVTSPPIPSAAPPALDLRRFTPAEYARMLELGILPAGSPVGLRDGLIVLEEFGPGARAVPAYRFSVDQYHRLIDAGILCEGERLELLDGWVVTKMTVNPPHNLAVSLLEFEIERRLPSGWFRRIQSSVTTTASEPEPDLSVVRGPRRRYANRHPGPQDMALVAEVADSSLQHDQTVKLAVYVRDAIPVYWIINIPDRRVEVYTDPSVPGPTPTYRQRRDYGATDAVPLVLDGTHVADVPVADLLP